MTRLFALIGPPGSGKRTVGEALAALTGAALIDNHLINDPIFAAFGADGVRPLPPAVWPLVERVRDAVYEAVQRSPPDQSHIFTLYLADQPGEAEALERLHTLALVRGASFVPVWLHCPLSELQRRMTLPGRRERRKLRDPAALRESVIRTASDSLKSRKAPDFSPSPAARTFCFSFHSG